MGQTVSSERSRYAHLAGFVLCVGAIGLASWLFPRMARDFQKGYWGLNGAVYNKFLARLPREIQETLDSAVTAGSDEGRVSPPKIERRSGHVPPGTPIEVVSTESGSSIRYTLDGSVPTVASSLWSDDLVVESPVLLRAKTFSVGRFPSRTVTRTYLAGVDSSLPVVSIAIDPVHLYDPHAGIVANAEKRGRTWERRAVVSLVPAEGATVEESEVRLRVHGNTSRGAPRKSLRMHTQPGAVALEAALRHLVSDGSGAEHEWVLRHPPTMRQIYRERLGNRLAREVGLPAPPATPCVLLVNGKPWGVYDLMPRVTSGLVSVQGAREGVTLLRGSLAHPVAALGAVDDWESLYLLVEAADLREESAYESVSALVDLENLIDFWAYAIFAADVDRPDSNMEIYRDTGGDGRWRFLVYDTDQGFNYKGEDVAHDTLAWHLRDRPRPDLKVHGSPDSPRHVRSTVLFRKLMARDDFRRRFIERFEELLRGPLSAGRTAEIFEGIQREVEESLQLELDGFPGLERSIAASERAIEVERIREFLRSRPEKLEGILRRHFGD